MAQEQQRDNQSDLVSLYAQRMKARDRRPSPVVGRRPSARGVHEFGRRGNVRRTTFRSHRNKVVASALAATALVTGAGSTAASTVHYIQPGETLFGIAGEHGKSVDEIAQLNSIPDPNTIYAGNHLLIEPGEADGDHRGPKHVIQPGEWLSTIAPMYGVTVEALAEENNIENHDQIYHGDVLTIPVPIKAPAEWSDEAPGTDEVDTTPVDGSVPANTDEDTPVAPPATDEGTEATESSSISDDEGYYLGLHLIIQGETLNGIARRYGVDPVALAELNGITDENQIKSGNLLQIPNGESAATQETTVRLNDMPMVQQSLSLSCESAALSMATAYWGNQVSEWVFIENMPYSQNPHIGFRGDMNGAFGGTDNYGVYAEPLANMLGNYGFNSEVFYGNGSADQLTAHIDNGNPVLAWMTAGATVQQPITEVHEGNEFTLVPGQHAVVVYGYDEDGVYIADPGDGQYRTVGWGDFMRSWGYFDGMSLAVYPKS